MKDVYDATILLIIEFSFTNMASIQTTLVNFNFSCIFRRQAGGRKLLLDVIPVVWNDISLLIKSSYAAQSPLLRKYLMKLTQRIGLTCLPHRSPSWRYVVRNAVLSFQFQTFDLIFRSFHVPTFKLLISISTCNL